MSVARKILENTIVQVIGKVVTALFSIVVLKIITGYLGTAGYGDYTTVYQYLAFFGIIADFGIYTITVKEMSRDESKIPMILGNVMGLRTLLLIIAMGLAAAAVFLVPSYQNTLIPMGVLIATLSTFLTLLNGTISSVLQVHLKMQYATISLIVGKAASVAYMVWVAFYAFKGDPILGFYHLLWAGVIGNLIMYLITAYYTRRFSRITYRFDWPYWRKIFFTALPFGVALVLNNIYFRIDVILMTLILPRTVALADGSSVCQAALCSDTEVGLYGVAMRMLEMLIIIPVYFMNSVLPVMTRFIEEQNEKIKKLMQYSFDFLVASGLPLLIGGFILAVPIIQFISDNQFVGGVIYEYGSDLAVRFLMFAMLFSFLSALFGFTLVVLNKQLKLMYINAAAVVLNLMGNIALIPAYGFRGAAITSVLSQLFILILTYHFAKKELQFRLSGVSLAKMTFSSLVMGLAVWLGFIWMTGVWFVWQLALLIPLGGVIYAISMVGTKAITPDMMTLLRKK